MNLIFNARLVIFLVCILASSSVNALACNTWYGSFEYVSGSMSFDANRLLYPRFIRWDLSKGDLPLDIDEVVDIFNENIDTILEFQLEKDKHAREALALMYPHKLTIKIQKVELEDLLDSDEWEYKVYYTLTRKFPKEKAHDFEDSTFEAKPIVVNLNGDVLFPYLTCGGR